MSGFYGYKPGYGYPAYGNAWILWILLLIVLAFAFFPAWRGYFGF